MRKGNGALNCNSGFNVAVDVGFEEEAVCVGIWVHSCQDTAAVSF